MSTIGNVTEIILSPSSLTGQLQIQQTTDLLKIKNASLKINSFPQSSKNMQGVHVQEIGIQDDLESIQQDLDDLQIDNSENYQETEIMHVNSSSSADFKLQNEFLKSVQRTNDSMRLTLDNLIKFG